ncbi:hypothetical protein SDRG_08565 [Saprolegnia diclina VS20]|uniref:Ankyrin repeat protein n=1 Tax=Saprolegnia diclina (strain VS20) TaxID=1156394 RepID=T0Q7N1_SAPDV|nr:hypothetical protein SDRG_08565 [Saprolegnia diclina VS20]EQC33884.1 hypothetical protein SDRG_08565 [Saprolegnia diclina VS20]|eukprot:XP_008612679.1 hypothetical protein SDRG_08565 [Saprolegnia diclina VS20]
MAATFTSVVLGQPELAAIIFGYQAGVSEDVRPAFIACKQLLEFDSSSSMYWQDESFRETFAPNAVWSHDHEMFFCYQYALRRNEIDARLPLHLAITEGFTHLTKRILGCRPDLASEDAIILAFLNDHVEIAEVLLDARATKVPELYRRGVIQSDKTGDLSLLNSAHIEY